MSTANIHLYRRSPPYVGATPFAGDLFNRKKLAERLTGYIDRLRDGCVIAIDADWGEGKTWFGRNWHALLVSQKYHTVYLDAFENDFVDDPFLIVASEMVAIARQANDESSRA